MALPPDCQFRGGALGNQRALKLFEPKTDRTKNRSCRQQWRKSNLESRKGNERRRQKRLVSSGFAGPTVRAVQRMCSSRKKEQNFLNKKVGTRAMSHAEKVAISVCASYMLPFSIYSQMPETRAPCSPKRRSSCAQRNRLRTSAGASAGTDIGTSVGDQRRRPMIAENRSCSV